MKECVKIVGPCSKWVQGVGWVTEVPVNLLKQLGYVKLEDKIENGTLIELPCKVGDIVYEVFYSKYEARILEMKVMQIVIQETIDYRCKTTSRCLYNYGWVKNEDFGKTVFLTKAEAEKKLEALRNEQTR